MDDIHGGFKWGMLHRDDPWRRAEERVATETVDWCLKIHPSSFMASGPATFATHPSPFIMDVGDLKAPFLTLHCSWESRGYTLPANTVLVLMDNQAQCRCIYSFSNNSLNALLFWMAGSRTVLQIGRGDVRCCHQSAVLESGWRQVMLIMSCSGNAICLPLHSKSGTVAEMNSTPALVLYKIWQGEKNI